MSAEDQPGDAEHRNPKSENRNWIWFFVAVAVLSAAAISINWAYNARQQLTMEQLQTNEDLWDKAGPADYDLSVDKTIQSANADEPFRDRIEVKVRKKRVVAASLNGLPMQRRLWDDNDMPGWFGFVERFLKIDEAPGAAPTFRTAQFDPRTGQLLHFTRSVSTTRERQELVLQLKPAAN
jgi:hypothetical protein